MPDYEQFIADAHSLARDSGYLNRRAKERLLNASNAIRFALSNDCELQSHINSQSPNTPSMFLGDGSHDRLPGYISPPSQLTYSSRVPQSQAWEQPASASIPYASKGPCGYNNASTTYISPRLPVGLQSPSAVSTQLGPSTDSSIHAMGDFGPFRFEPPYPTSAESQASTVKFGPFASSPVSFPTNSAGLLQDASLRQMSQRSRSMKTGRTPYHPTYAPDFLERNSRTTPLGHRGDSHYLRSTGALLRDPNLMIDPETGICNTTYPFLSYDPRESALAPIHGTTETVPYWLHTSPSSLESISDSCTLFDTSVPQMPPTQVPLATEGQDQRQHSSSETANLEFDGITLSPPDTERGSQITTQEKSLPAPASPGIENNMDGSIGQYSDFIGEAAVLTDDFFQNVESSSQAPLYGGNTPESGMDFHYSDPSTPDTAVGASIYLSREDLTIVGRAQKLLASNSKPVNGISKSRTLTKAGKALTTYSQSKYAKVGRRRACVLCKKDKKECLLSGGSCARCTSILGSRISGHICLDGLQVHRNMFELGFRISYVQDALLSMFGPSEKLRLHHPFQISDNAIFAYTNFIEVEVRSCLPSCYMESIVSTGSSKLLIPSRVPRTFKPLSSKGSINEYVILPDNLPTIDALDTWSRGALARRPEIFPEDLDGTLDAFLQSYYEFVPHLPMREEVNSVLRIVSLFRFFDSRRPVVWPFEVRGQYQNQNAPESPLANALLNSYGSPHVNISQVAEGQLYGLAAKGVVDTENALLGTLDDHMRRCDRKNTAETKCTKIMLGLLIRRLSLLYKRRLNRYGRFQDSEVGRRMQKAEHMYGGCVTAFTTVYRKQDSPYSRQWRLEDHSQAFGNDCELMNMFQQVIDAERQYCNNLKNKGEEDFVLEHLFLNPKRHERSGNSWTD